MKLKLNLKKADYFEQSYLCRKHFFRLCGHRLRLYFDVPDNMNRIYCLILPTIPKDHYNFVSLGPGDEYPFLKLYVNGNSELLSYEVHDLYREMCTKYKKDILYVSFYYRSWRKLWFPTTILRKIL